MMFLNDQPTYTGLLLANFALLVVSSLIAGLAELLWPGLLPEAFKTPVSIIINEYLEWRHPVYDSNGVRTRIPSCTYAWPNGQGDAGKFLSGIENSAAWEKQHGAVYRIWSGMQPEIVLTQPGQLQAVFKDSDKHSKAPANNSGFYMSQLLGQCVGLISGPDWRATRTVTETPFRHSAVALQIEAFQRRIEEHFDELHTAVEGGRGNLERGLLHPVDDLSLLPFRIVTDMFYGRLPRPLRAQLEALIPLRMRIFTEHVIRGGGLHRFAWARVLPTTANADLRRFKREWKAFNAAALDECTRRALAYAKQGGGADDDDEGGRGSGACAPPPPVMGMFAAVAAGIITEEQLLQTLDESLFANLDVTVGGLSWVPVFLAAHPAAQRRLRDEIAREGGATGDRMRRYLLDGRSTFLSACVLESSRLRPLAAFSVPQAAPTPRWVEAKNGGAAGGGGGEGGRGYMIPAGTSFVVDTYALNVRNEAWAPDNEAFRPDRFLEGTDKDARDRRYLFWRFGFGPRQCMGRHAADLMLRMVVAHIVRNYHLDMLPGDKAAWERSRESWITHPNFKLQCVQIEED